MSELKGRRVLVVGVGTGAGRSIALALAASGADVLLASRSVERIAGICEEVRGLGASCSYHRVDATVREEVERLASTLEHSYGGVTDVVYNAGGYFSLDPVEAVSEELFDRAIALNLKGFFLVVKAFLSQVARARGGFVAVVASPAAILAGNVAYAASKGGLIWAVKRLAKELADRGVKVNCVGPGPTSHGLAPLEAQPAKLRSWDPHPASDIGWAVVYLLSTRSARLTGECLSLDGGLSIP